MATNRKKRYAYIRERLLRPGSKVIAKKTIYFIDETRHLAGHVYLVTEQNISYFIVNFDDYIVYEY